MSQNELGDEDIQGEKSEPEEEQPDIEPPLELKLEVLRSKIRGGIKKIGKTANGLDYAYTSLELGRQNIDQIYEVLKDYPHLRKINFSDNILRDVSGVLDIKYLTHLDLSNNRIESLKAFQVPGTLEFLEELNLQKNQITRLETIVCINLKKLNLNKNSIETCEGFGGHKSIQVLELRKNRLRTCVGLQDMPSLTNLYLAQNSLQDIQGLKNLPSLKILHLRKNELESFGSEVPDLQYLNYLNLRETKIRTLAELSRLLKYEPSLRTLSCQESPILEEVPDNLKKEIIMILPFLKKFNKEVIEQEEVDDALKELEERRIEEERKRKEEEEARLLAEQEEREAALKKQDDEANE